MAQNEGPKTLLRGLKILETISRAGSDGLKIPQIALLTGVTRPTVYRFVEVLHRNGYISKATEAGRYVCNSNRLDVKAPVDDEFDVFKEVLKNISAATGDSSFLIRQEQADSLCIHREIGWYPLQVLSIQIRHKQPLGVGAAGLALLAALPDEERERVLEQNAERLPQFGGLTLRRLKLLVKTTQERGWSVVGNAAVQGVLGVGIAIADHRQQPRFAISVSSVEARFTRQRQRDVVDIIKREVSRLKSYKYLE